MDYTRDALLIHYLNKTHHQHHSHPTTTTTTTTTPPPPFLERTRTGVSFNHHHHQNHHDDQQETQQLLLEQTNLVNSPEDIIIDNNNNNFSYMNNFSLLNDSFAEGYVPYEQRIETYLVPVLFAIIFIIGVLGNGALIFIFIKHRTMRNVPNMYICSLAIGDILVIFFCVPFTSTVYTVEGWPYGLVVCKFSEYIKDVSIGVSVFTLTALSADRYFAIVDPMRKLAGRRATRITCLTIGGIWVVSIVIALPSVLFSYVKVFNEESDRPIHVCYPFPEEFGEIYPKVMVLSKALVYYFVPLVFITGFYSEMAHHLVLSTINMPGESQGQGRQIQARKKVAKMVLSFVVIFAMCFFLSHVFLLWFYFDPNSEDNYNSFWHVVRILGFCLSFLNSCINPITLYCVSGTFRKYFNQYLFCCCIQQPHGRRLIKSTICCRDGQPSRRQSFQNSTSFKSDGGGLHLFGNNSTVRRNNGLHRASTLTSTTSLRTKVTWDANKPTTSCSPTHRLLQHNNSSTSPSGGTPIHDHHHLHSNLNSPSRRNNSYYKNNFSTSPRHNNMNHHRQNPYSSNLVPIESTSDENYHLYENPTSNLLNNKNTNVLLPLKDIESVHNVSHTNNSNNINADVEADFLKNHHAENNYSSSRQEEPFSTTSFIENSKTTSTKENVK